METRASSNTRPLNPGMLLLARESRGWSQTEAAERVGITQGRLSKMEAGLLPVPPDVVGSLADVLSYPEDFFRQGDAVYGPSTTEFFHRKRQSAPIRVLDQIHAWINIRRIHIDRLLRSVASTKRLQFEHVDLDEYQSPEEIARKVRADWLLPKGPIKDLVRTIEAAGGIVVRFSFGTPKIDAVSTWVPGLPPLFFMNKDMPADRERLTLAHELGHILMHATVRPDMETEANRFAAEFLMPELDIRPQLRDVNLARLAGLKPLWRVSMQALLHRAQDLATITQARAKSLWVQLSQKGYRKHEPPELAFPHEETRALRELVDLHLGSLGYSIADLAQLLALHEEDVLVFYGSGPNSTMRPRLSLA